MGVPPATARMDEGYERDAHAEMRTCLTLFLFRHSGALISEKLKSARETRLNMTFLCMSYTDTP